ncbi:MAG: UV DNA damage repair endonuclease UvsE [Candidatus Bathyarchaeota archaeon]|nr:UV DNA damage repair endonuclease UvsE [Candidatus Bathyarchaeota archaeon]
MRIGYPCINNSLDCKSDRTFRLKSYSEERLKETVKNNLGCLLRILEFNLKYKILFFRITSDLVPFASHPICQFNWQKKFKKEFATIGNFIKKHRIRISMHPDQFILLNSLSERIYENSIRELTYHADVMDLMELEYSSKIQLHVGGIYGDKEKSMRRFITKFKRINVKIKKRLVIENDERLYSAKDCLNLNRETSIPVLFDTLHHECNNTGESIEKLFKELRKTWHKRDGLLMVDYSSQYLGGKMGKHADTIDIKHFKNFLEEIKSLDFDIMLEIKDKERSAIKAVTAVSNDVRLLLVNK